jgi:hypothetical protein
MIEKFQHLAGRAAAKPPGDPATYCNAGRAHAERE